MIWRHVKAKRKALMEVPLLVEAEPPLDIEPLQTGENFLRTLQKNIQASTLSLSLSLPPSLPIRQERGPVKVLEKLGQERRTRKGNAPNARGTPGAFSFFNIINGLSSAGGNPSAGM